MALPIGVTTATITFGVPVSFTGAFVRSTVSIQPSAALVHTATGTPLVNFIEDVITTEGTSGQFTLPHTDQTGFQDEAGNSYQNWYYTATITYSSDKGTLPARTKTFQLTSGQTVVDLDLLSAGAPVLPYTAQTATVSSVAGKTGAITSLDVINDADAQAALNATYADKAVAARTARETRHRGLSFLPGPVTATRPAYFERFNTDAGRCTRLKHIATEDIIDLSLVYGNYGNFDAEPNSSIRVRASVEYPSGSFFKAHFTGEDANRDVTITPGSIVNTQPVAVRIPKGATFYTNTLVVPVTAGGQYPSGGIIVAGGNAHEKCNPASATDYTTAANPGSISDQFAYGPIAVCGIGTAHGKSFGTTGTSISVGTGDTAINGLYEYGFIVRALNGQYAYIQGGSNGESASNWDEASNTNIGRHRFRGPLIGSCDVALQEHATNDFALGNATVATLQTRLIASWNQLALRGPRVYQFTCPPRTTTTDAWATTGNQTPVNARFGPEAGAGSDRQIFNTWLRDGAPILNGAAAATVSNAAGTVRAGQQGHPLSGFIDSAAAVEQLDATTNTWVWKPGYTGDGIHPNTAGHIAMAATINPALL